MPALVAGIHVLRFSRNEGVDGRNKSGHDEASNELHAPSITGKVSAEGCSVK
jgi:hypothetical protein